MEYSEGTRPTPSAKMIMLKMMKNRHFFVYYNVRMNETSCPFCLTNNLLKVKVLFEDDLWYFSEMHENAIQNAGMAITKRHLETPFEINKNEWERLRSRLPVFKSILDEKEKAQGYTIGWNIYPVGGQNVAHAHLHIIARYDDEPLAGKGIRYAFKAMENIRSKKSLS
jgi:histidine triad (HIT) family protein